LVACESRGFRLHERPIDGLLRYADHECKYAKCRADPECLGRWHHRHIYNWDNRHNDGYNRYNGDNRYNGSNGNNRYNGDDRHNRCNGDDRIDDGHDRRHYNWDDQRQHWRNGVDRYIDDCARIGE